MRLDRGSIVLVGLDPAIGHEQRGARPAVIISDPDVSDAQRFPILCVVPITGTAGTGSLYPRLAASRESRLRKSSFALVDQLRSIDKQRVQRVFGRISSSEMTAIDEGLRLYLGI
ncbi:MAG TPA: type II toxin-antitoxin system PemK/MazF family toxin [Gemmatimonadota bacterium]|nr:type II toxin-antitoxin system PemK/MazF family toxin [Gemmatimonadota bacterium]